MRTRPPLRAFFLVLLLVPPLLLLHRSLFGGQVFLPGDLLQEVYPWSSTMPPTEQKEATPWNVLRFDGIAQFYPWRLEAARSLRTGHLPLWNPYQFGAEGGTPLLANSQSAPLYPPNLLFALFPTQQFWYAFGLSAFLHLLVAAMGVFAFARVMGLNRFPALLSAFTFTLSAPVVTWLALPTFLAVYAWTPWLLLLIRYAYRAETSAGKVGAIIGAGAVAGLLILAGHLQIAFYALLTGGLYVLFCALQQLRTRQFSPVQWARSMVGGLTLTLLLAAPQLLPAIELSRVSHRAGGVSWETYQGYLHNSLPLRNLVTLLVPNFFGHPNFGNYWNDSPIGNNYAEWAAYIGVFPLVLAVFALALPWKGSGYRVSLPSERAFFAGLALLALLLSMGTPVNLIFFFGVPGFGQTGNPGRSLIVFAFAMSLLAGIGLEAFTQEAPADEKTRARPTRQRATLIALVILLLITSIGASFAAQFAREFLPNVPFGNLMQIAAPGLRLSLVLFVLVGGLLLGIPFLSRERQRLLPPLVLTLTVLDLFAWGADYNPTVSPDKVYPVTPGIVWLQKNAANALIAPLNRTWTLNQNAPTHAILPPNSATVYRLHDLSGYDSLFPGAAKERVRNAAMQSDFPETDPSPAANGNMVFIKSARIAQTLGARFVVISPEDNGKAGVVLPGWERVYSGADMEIYENRQGNRDDGQWHTPSVPYSPVSFRLGLFLGLCGVGFLSATATYFHFRKSDLEQST